MKVCDMKSCQKTVPNILDTKSIRIKYRDYELCLECAEHLEDFIQKHLHEGHIDISTSYSTHSPALQERINLPPNNPNQGDTWWNHYRNIRQVFHVSEWIDLLTFEGEEEE